MISGYCWPQSGKAGQTIELAVSVDQATCVVEVVRVGQGEEIVATFANVPTSVQPVPDNAAEAGCGWETTLEIEIDAAWSSGFYLVRLRSSTGHCHREA